MYHSLLLLQMDFESYLETLSLAGLKRNLPICIFSSARIHPLRYFGYFYFWTLNFLQIKLYISWAVC